MIELTTPNEITGVILAGGAGRRMEGQDKGLVELNGKPFISWTLERLRPQVKHIIVSANRNLSTYKALGLTVISDESPESYEGPVAGIVRCLEQLETPWACVVPVDAPLIPPELVATLETACSRGANLILLEIEGRLQPLFGLYSKSLLASLKAYYDQGERKLIKWCEQQQPIILSWEGDTFYFRNLNSTSERNQFEIELQDIAPK